MHLKDKMIKSVFMVTALSILGKITGFVRETVTAAYYGAGGATDAYFVAYSLPSILFSIIGGSMGVIFVPMYAQQLKNKSQSSHRFASNIINMVLLMSIVFSILGMIFSKHIVKLIAPRLLDKNLAIAAHLARIMFPMFIFISVSYIVTGVLQSHESFVVPSLVSVPFNMIIVLGTILFAERYGVYALAWATLIGAVAQLIVQLPAVAKRLRYRFYINLKESSALIYWKLIIPVILGTAIDKVNIMVDNMLASFLIPGSISAINYSTKLLNFADSIAIGAIIMVIYPKFAKMNADRDYDGLGHTAYNAVIAISQIILPIMAIAIIFNEDIVSLIFERGAFGGNDTKLTAYALAYYAIGLWGVGVGSILSRVFYSLEDTGTPMKVSIATLACNVLLNLFLVRSMGIGGLGLATSLSSTLGVLALLHFIRKKVDSFNVKHLLKEEFKIALAVLCMVYGMIILRGYISTHNFYINLILIIVAGLVIYVALSWILRIGLMGKIKFHKEYQDITDTKRIYYSFDAPVSVIIPCYMCERTIERAVSSVWNQTWRPRELILIEDCSPDHGATRRIIRSLVNRYPSDWLKVIYLDINSGLENGRNIGWYLANQRYIAFLDADDAWHPQKIEIQLKIMLKNPHISISGHSFELVNGSTNSIYTMYTKEYFKRIEVRDVGRRKMLISNQLPTSSVMLKNRWLSQRFQSRKYYSEDYLLWLTMVLLGYKAIKINMPLYYIYNGKNEVSLSKRLWRMQKGKVDTYRILWAMGRISFISLVLLAALSYVKYGKRLVGKGIAYTIKKIKRALRI